MSKSSRRVWRTLTWPVRALFGLVKRSSLLTLLVWCLLVLGTGLLAVTSERVSSQFARLARTFTQAPTLEDRAAEERAALVATHDAALETRNAVDAGLRQDIETLETRLQSLEAEARAYRDGAERQIFLLEGEILVLKDDLSDATAVIPAPEPAPDAPDASAPSE